MVRIFTVKNFCMQSDSGVEGERPQEFFYKFSIEIANSGREFAEFAD